jgi:hypothetical protein
MEGGDLRMSSIDERVVQMKFENAAFERGVQQTLNSLAQLNKGLQLQGATKGLAGVSTIAGEFSSKMERSRNSLGQFTTSVQQSSTVATTFGQKIEASQGFISKLGTGISTLVGHVTSFGSKMDAGRNSLGQFTSGLGATNTAADRSASSLQKIEGAVSTLAGKFSALGSMATGALMNIGARASQAGLQLLNSFSFAPIMSGFHEYETNLNSIQTILANTQAAGTNLKDVNGALNELNHYADQTIYNFSEMAKNIGTFTAVDRGDQGYRQPCGSVGLQLGASFRSYVPALAGHIRRKGIPGGLELGRQRRYGRNRIPACSGHERREDGDPEQGRRRSQGQDEERHDRREVVP